MATTAFKGWLEQEIERQDVSRRELARRLAEKHPHGVTPRTLETSRRAIYKYLDPERPANPTEPTRRAFAEALGVDASQIPADDDEDEDLYMALLLRAMRTKKSRHQLPEVTDKYLTWGLRNGVFSELIAEELAA